MAEPQFESDTRADLELVTRQLRAELAKPADQQNVQFLREGTAVLRAFEEKAGMTGQATELAQQGTAFQQEGVQPKQVQVPNQGEQVTVTPQKQLATEIATMSARNRAEDIGDFFQRPFMDDLEQEGLANKRRVERAAARLDIESKARASGVDPAELQVADIAGGLAPDLIAGAIPGLGQARSLAGGITRVAAEAGTGAVLGGSTVPLDEDAGTAAAIGGTLGLGGGLISEAPGAAADFLRREIRAAKRSGRDERLQAISEETGIDLSLGERTGSPSVGVAEQGVQGRPGGPRDVFLKERQQQVEARFDDITDSLNTTNASPDQIVTQTKKAYDDTISQLSEESSATFRANVEPSLESIGAKIDTEGRIVGGFKFVKTPELIAELKTQAGLLADQPLTGTRTGVRDIQREIDALEEAQARGKGLDLGQVQRLLADLAKQNKPTGIVIKDNSQAVDILSTPAVQRALNRDLDTIAAGEGEFAENVAGLQAARKEFGIDRADIDAFKGRAVDKLLGKNLDPSAEDFGKRVLAMDKKSFDELLQVADDASPELGSGIRAAVFEELIDRRTNLDVAGSTAARSATALDVPAVMGEMNAMPFKKFEAFIGSGLPVKETRKIRNTLVALQAITEGPLVSQLKSSARNMREKFEQYAINAASQDAGFISRLLAGELAPGAMERLLFTPEGQRALSRLGQPNIGRAEFANAANVLVTAMSDDEKQRAETDKQRGQQRTLERVGNIQ
jgi:hypothetical protein